MTTSKGHAVRSHDELNAMLPWYLNGTLSDTDSKRVEAHLVDCTECRNERSNCDAMRAAVQTGELAPFIPTTCADDILSMDTAAQNDVNSSPLSPLRQPWAVAAAATLVAIAMLSSSNPGQEGSISGSFYHTATATGTTQSVDYVLQMQFLAVVSDSDRDRVIQDLEGVAKWAVDEHGVYEVHLQLTEPSLASLEAYEKQIRSLYGVKSAEFIAMQLPVR